MSDHQHCIEHITVINNVEYTLQSRTVELDDGQRHAEYRVLLDGDEIKGWTRGEILPLFGIGRS
ncbi:hypothetical protein [Herbaspirillum sp. YR522]|uniref:hypothetical protein n=1 Tax=Herbaspirillum sp. YR522 TaxID=1144342 RepID=UPI00026F7F5D|nr:hypothetical protein [Herbaspirillum sp. YR522]EJN08117.1 hypothetical protein PMI40_01480 [Herbaspirillum sp. YR522]